MKRGISSANALQHFPVSCGIHPCNCTAVYMHVFCLGAPVLVLDSRGGVFIVMMRSIFSETAQNSTSCQASTVWTSISTSGIAPGREQHSASALSYGRGGAGQKTGQSYLNGIPHKHSAILLQLSHIHYPFPRECHVLGWV